MDFKLEICVDSVESAVIAQSAGADRVELCNNLAEGGTTPSHGTIVSARNNLSIGLHVIIRPRGGDFLYSETEFDIMRRDIEACGELGVDGVVMGILLPDGEIDIDRTAILAEFAEPMSVTFHRAFDMCADPVQGLADVISTGAARLLTSGHKESAPEGKELIRTLIRQASTEIIIMPGGGLNETNIKEFARFTGAREFHLSARSMTDSNMSFRRNGVTMNGSLYASEYTRKVADPEKITNIINILKMI
jgi:copper homeostasis protein